MDTSVVIPDREGRSIVSGKRKYFDDKQWQDEPNKENTDLQSVLQALLQVNVETLKEIKLLRHGMIDSGACRDVRESEVEGNLTAT